MTDIQPSYGIRWYIMIEVFKRYNFLYSVMISMHIWVYVYPLHGILHKFHRYSGYDKTGELFVAIVLAVCYINHPFPTFYEYGMVIAFFIPHYEIIKDVKSAYFTFNSWVIGAILAASMWDVWINRLGGNSNFFFFQTVFCNLVAIGFVVGLLYQLVEKTNKVLSK